jgi:hypothetical protein
LRESWHDVPNSSTRAISLFDFLPRWLPGLHRDGHLAGTNWTGDLIGLELEPSELQTQLHGQLPQDLRVQFREMLELLRAHPKYVLRVKGIEPSSSAWKAGDIPCEINCSLESERVKNWPCSHRLSLYSKYEQGEIGDVGLLVYYRSLHHAVRPLGIPCHLRVRVGSSSSWFRQGAPRASRPPLRLHSNQGDLPRVIRRRRERLASLSLIEAFASPLSRGVNLRWFRLSRAKVARPRFARPRRAEQVILVELAQHASSRRAISNRCARSLVRVNSTRRPFSTSAKPMKRAPHQLRHDRHKFEMKFVEGFADGIRASAR